MKFEGRPIGQGTAMSVRDGEGVLPQHHLSSSGIPWAATPAAPCSERPVPWPTQYSIRHSEKSPQKNSLWHFWTTDEKTTTKLAGSNSQHNSKIKPYLWDCREKPTITLWNQTQQEWAWSQHCKCRSQSIRLSPSSQMAVTSCHYYPVTSSAPEWWV